MSVRLEMLQVARLAPKLLGESTELIRTFFQGQLTPEGGFKDRAGRADLYYTVFGIEGLLALQVPLPTSTLAAYLESFGTGSNLNFVHLCCLARCHAALRGREIASGQSNWKAAVLQAVERYRSADGGYNISPGAPHGTAYGIFMALGAYQDLGATPSGLHRLQASLAALMTPEGVWGNERGMKAGATNTTAAAVTFLRQSNAPVASAVSDWLLARAHPQGGFLATPSAPLPDLLSTATALHALAGLQTSFVHVREACLDFIDSLWTNQGGFHGHWGDDMLDCEYTYYGLLALGHLSL